MTFAVPEALRIQPTGVATRSTCPSRGASGIRP